MLFLNVLLFVSLLLLLAPSFVTPLFGVDLSKAMSVADWTNLAVSAGQTVDFAVIRLMLVNGSIDKNGPRNVRSAYSSGIRDISGYIYPCVNTSVFVQINNIKCPNLHIQVKTLISTLKNNLESLQNYTRSTYKPTARPTIRPTARPTNGSSTTAKPTRPPTRAPTRAPPTGQPSSSPSSQPSGSPTTCPSCKPTSIPTTKIRHNTTAPTPAPSRSPSPRPSPRPTPKPTPSPTTAVPTSMPTFIAGETMVYLRQVFLMVEDQTPQMYYDLDPAVNRAYFLELKRELFYHGYQLGVFTTLHLWTSIMGNFTYLPKKDITLWMPRYDGNDNMDFFVPFDGWKDVYIKQYLGGSAEARRLDTWRIGYDFKDASRNDTGVITKWSFLVEI